MVNLQFLVIPCKSVYNCIIGRPVEEILDEAASPVHLNGKPYHNAYYEILIIGADLSGSWRMHKALKHDHKGKYKQKAMEMNIAYPTEQIERQLSNPLKEKTMDPYDFDANGFGLGYAEDHGSLYN